MSIHKVGRTRRSYPEEEGQVMTKGSVGRTTPAVAASERRKSLKLVRMKREQARGERCRLKHSGNVKGILFIVTLSISSLHLIHPLAAVWCRGTYCQPRALTGHTVHVLVLGKHE